MGEFEEKLNSILSSPEDMEKIVNLARSLSASSEVGEKESEHNHNHSDDSSDPPESALSRLGDIDPRVFKIMSKLMGEYSSSGDDGKAAILNSIKPYLKEERKTSIDKALEVLKLSKLARIVMSEFGGDFHL